MDGCRKECTTLVGRTKRSVEDAAKMKVQRSTGSSWRAVRNQILEEVGNCHEEWCGDGDPRCRNTGSGESGHGQRNAKRNVRSVRESCAGLQFCLSAIDASAAGLVAEELLMKEAVAEEFWGTVSGRFFHISRARFL